MVPVGLFATLMIAQMTMSNQIKPKKPPISIPMAQLPRSDWINGYRTLVKSEITCRYVFMTRVWGAFNDAVKRVMRECLSVTAECRNINLNAHTLWQGPALCRDEMGRSGFGFSNMGCVPANG